MKLFKKKLDIENYLNLEKKFNLLFIQINKRKIQDSNVIQNFS